MHAIGTRVQLPGGTVGRITVAFADGAWARKFLDCPWCDQRTWEARTDDADFGEDSRVQYLVEDIKYSTWHIVDARRVEVVRDQMFGGSRFKVGGTI